MIFVIILPIIIGFGFSIYMHRQDDLDSLAFTGGGSVWHCIYNCGSLQYRSCLECNIWKSYSRNDLDV